MDENLDEMIEAKKKELKEIETLINDKKAHLKLLEKSIDFKMFTKKMQEYMYEELLKLHNLSHSSIYFSNDTTLEQKIKYLLMRDPPINI